MGKNFTFRGTPACHWGSVHKGTPLYRGRFSELGGQANIGIGPYTFAHIYQDQS